MRILVLTSESVTADDLRTTIGGEADDAEVLVVAPALQDSPLRFWMSDVDDAISRADGVQHDSVRMLDDAGIDVEGDTGESNPLTAIEDALVGFDADRIVVFRHRDDDLAYHEDSLVGELEERFERPVQTQLISRP
ncbi:MAG TPA: hypothetical protein VHZ75_10260 [Solirubrobacteraceae bacterium]|nr:hypothetical protein [Solirubrobacteraceae bacterium]